VSNPLTSDNACNGLREPMPGEAGSKAGAGVVAASPRSSGASHRRL